MIKPTYDIEVRNLKIGHDKQIRTSAVMSLKNCQHPPLA
jgi:hypothetical protein